MKERNSGNYLLFIIFNLILLIYYIKELTLFYLEQINYDGWRYIFFFSAINFFAIVLITLYLSQKNFKYFWMIILNILIHNLSVGFGIKYFPTAGIVFSLTIIFILLLKKNDLIK